MFIAAKPATARHFISQRAWRASSVSARSGSKRMGAVADVVPAPRSASPAASSSSRQSTARRRLVKLSRASTTPGICFRPPSILRMQPAQPTPSTARSICAVPSRRCTNDRKIERLAPWHSSSIQDDAVARAEQPLAVARQFDDQIPLAGRPRAADARETARRPPRSAQRRDRRAGRSADARRRDRLQGRRADGRSASRASISTTRRAVGRGARSPSPASAARPARCAASISRAKARPGL